MITYLTKGQVLSYNNSRTKSANVAHLVERHLAKVEVASSSLVVRSNIAKRRYLPALFCRIGFEFIYSAYSQIGRNVI